MGWKFYATHLLRLAFAAALLWWDQRLFLFYAFTILLNLWNDIDRLRAMVRVFQVLNEIRLAALAQHAGVPPELVSKLMEDSKNKVSKQDWDSLESDLQFARNRWNM